MLVTSETNFKRLGSIHIGTSAGYEPNLTYEAWRLEKLPAEQLLYSNPKMKKITNNQLIIFIKLRPAVIAWKEAVEKLEP